jgi:serine/threonine-protein kinase HipA
VGDEVAICVERYDRVKQDGTWLRIHQEDVCQALGVRPEMKYQNEGGPSPQAIGKLIRDYSTESEGDLQVFFLALIFNWFIGGSDAHAKNYSLLLGSNQGVRLAPLYDISSALPYDGIARRKLKLAMKIGSVLTIGSSRRQPWVSLGKRRSVRCVSLSMICLESPSL